jgi:predicted metalloprotease with PDZ domain
MMTHQYKPVSGIHCEVHCDDVHQHRFTVEIRVPSPQAQQRVALPVWIPGSYLVREFSRHLNGLQAFQGADERPVQQVDKCCWQIECTPQQALVLRYQVQAVDQSVRSAWLDADRGFFNGTSLFLRVDGYADRPHTLHVHPPRSAPAWSLATGLTAVRTRANGFGRYRAADYDELVDCPVEMGPFWSGEFTAGGVTHRLVVAGAAPGFDSARLLDETRRICETVIRFWHGRGKPPFDRYIFFINAVHSGYGGLEHRNSTALICNRADLPRRGEKARTEGHTTLLGLICHEYFHTWCVKRLRPQEFTRYDYSQENYTRLLWFFEGFTSYYDDLLLLRAGLVDLPDYLALLTKTVQQVLQTPGRRVQSVAQASFDAWIRYYRPDADTPNTSVSYYTKGALVALCFDLSLRQSGKGTLDSVMRGLWRRCKGGPMQEADFVAELERCGGRSFAAEVAAWIHGTDELPLRTLLTETGMVWKEIDPAMAQWLGLKVSESTSGVVIDTVLRGGAGEQAGLAPGDEWLAVESGPPGKRQVWRILKLDELRLYGFTPPEPLDIWVSRDRRVLKLRLKVSDPARKIALAAPEKPDAATTWPQA